MKPLGVGTKTKQEALESLQNMTNDLKPISIEEYQQRIEKAQSYMQDNDIAALYLNAGTNLKYFTGMQWYASERMVGAILPAKGDVQFIAPYFEIGTLLDYQVVEGPIHGWQEEQSPYQLFLNVLEQHDIGSGAKVAIDESAAFFIFDGI